MQLGEILDGSFNIFRRHFALFMRLSVLLVWLPAAILMYFQVRFSGNPLAAIALLEEHTGTVILAGLAWLVIATAAGLMLKAGTIRIISDSYLGQEPDLGSALRLGVEKIVPTLLVSISKTLLIFIICLFGVGGLVGLVMAGRMAGPAVSGLLGFAGGVGLVWLVIFVACGYGLTTPIVVLEDLSSSFDAFGRSWELTRGAKRKIFLTAVVAWLISQFLPQMVVSSISGVLGASSALQPLFIVLAALLSIVLAPILPCALTLLYYDLRVRREAFDLQILSDQLGPQR